jgi:hypothetical protein
MQEGGDDLTQNLKGRHHLDEGINTGIVLKWIIKNQVDFVCG